MPLINYRIGDLVKMDSEAEIIEQPSNIVAFQGRIKETLEIGGKVYCLGEFEDLLLEGDLPIAQYQINAIGHHLKFIYTTIDGQQLLPSFESDLRNRLSRIMSSTSDLLFEHHHSLFPQSSGKFKILSQ